VTDTAPIIRPATKADAESIARLSGQLGYPASAKDVRQRLQAMIGASPDPANDVILVAEKGDVIGWIHAFVARRVEGEPFAEIGGLVTDKAHRGRGIGRRLLASAEAWARDRGLGKVRVRSNTVRQRAQGFYESLGYTVTKTQWIFDKTLDDSG
jgi:GNAT superfamily N-acetyltransferase